MRRTVNLRVHRRKSTFPAVSRTHRDQQQEPEDVGDETRDEDQQTRDQEATRRRPSAEQESGGRSDRRRSAAPRRRLAPSPATHRTPTAPGEAAAPRGYRSTSRPSTNDEELDDRDDHQQREEQEHAFEGTGRSWTPLTRLRPPARGAAQARGRRDRGACAGRRSCPSRARADVAGCWSGLRSPCGRCRGSARACPSSR